MRNVEIWGFAERALQGLVSRCLNAPGSQACLLSPDSLVKPEHHYKETSDSAERSAVTVEIPARSVLTSRSNPFCPSRVDITKGSRLGFAQGSTLCVRGTPLQHFDSLMSLFSLQCWRETVSCIKGISNHAITCHR